MPFQPVIQSNRNSMESVSCAICGEDNAAFLFSKWGHNVVRCRHCGLSYVNPRNFRVESDDYFRGPYLSTIEENGTLKSGIEHLYSAVVNNLNTYLAAGRLLDVGCAMGHFMAFARGRGWSVHGVECSRYAADYGRERWGLRIQPVCDLREARLPDNHFDACVLIEVAEHLPYPRVTFTEVFRLLKPGGMVYVTTPNFSSFRAMLQREDWQAVIPTGHLYYFSADSLGKLLTSIGFIQLINLTLPARLDSELDSARGNGTLRMGPTDLAEIRRQAAIEDDTKLSNARGEGLVICAVKPRSEHDVIGASVRFSGSSPGLDGRLVRVPGDDVEDQKVYLVREGLKHWVTTVEWLHNHGMRLEETIQIEREVLDSILTGSPLE